MTLDTVARNVAETLIDQFGGTLTIRRVTRTFDVATGTTSETTSDTVVTGSPPEPFNERRIDGTLIKTGDMRTIVAAQGTSIVPDLNTDQVIFGGETWSLVRVTPIYSGAQIAAFELHLRK